VIALRLVAHLVARDRARRGGVDLMPSPELLTLPQVAQRLQVSRWTVYQLIWSGQLPSVHIGRCHRIRVIDFEAYLQRLGPDAA
jgi:excisionase family DNA binding protein